MLLKFKILIIFFLFLFGNFAFANINNDDEFDIDITNKRADNDPFRKANNCILRGNLYLYDYALIPIAKAYEKYVNFYVRWIMKNMGNNYVITPRDFTISMLDGDLEGAAISFWRFSINSTLGLFGAYDIAKDFELTPYNKNFNLLMQFYGVPEGPYVILPFFGSGTVRSTIGMFFDRFSNPLSFNIFTNYILPTPQYFASTINPIFLSGGLNMVNTTAAMDYLSVFNFTMASKETILTINSSSIDLYNGYKNIYYQFVHRRFENYDELRKKKKLSLKNICDNELAIESPEECNNESGKIYVLANREF